jgi:cation diffusion facilitator family transporter
MMALRRMAYLSVAAALVTMGLKFLAFWLTGSVSLLSDAAESSVNLLAGLIALAAITVAHRPADEDHAYGHDKAEYFSSGAEGALILVAAATIAYAAIERLANPAPLADLGPGLLVATAAAGVNWVVATVMLRVGRRYDSITIEADAHHLMTDVWTSGGVIAGLLVVLLSPSWAILDPLIACVVAIKIVYTGVDLVRRSVHGLMDVALPPAERAIIDEALREACGSGAAWHNLRTRKSGSRRFIDLHLTVPGATTVQAAHDLCNGIEAAIEGRLANVHTTIHVEPEEDASSWEGMLFEPAGPAPPAVDRPRPETEH